MNDHERVFIDALIHEACDLLCETAIQRCEGPTNVLRKLREDPNSDGIWTDRFISMFLSENALNNDAGSCTILEALASRPMPSVEGKSISDVLKAASQAAFTQAVLFKADEALERASMQESMI